MRLITAGTRACGLVLRVLLLGMVRVVRMMRVRMGVVVGRWGVVTLRLAPRVVLGLLLVMGVVGLVVVAHADTGRRREHLRGQEGAVVLRRGFVGSTGHYDTPHYIYIGL